MSVHIWKQLGSQQLLSSTAQAIQNFRDTFESQVRESFRQFAHCLMEQEANETAGKVYGRKRGNAHVFRAGSDPATVRIAGQRVEVRKQRLKQGRRGQEVPLKSYLALRQGDMLTDKVMACMIKGLSTRNYDELLDEVAGGLGLSKSSVSRAFVEGSRQALEHLESRSLVGKTWCAVQVDAIYFGGRSVIVALGIEGSGRRWVLGLREGSTESAQVCIDLFQDLITRGFRTDLPILFVLDGGKGLRAAVRSVFGERCPVQRCLIHKARNIEEYLPEKTHREFRRRWKRITRCERFKDAKDEFGSTRKWLESISSEAVASLNEAGDELLTVYRLGAGRVLGRCLRSTNLIESTFSRVRTITHRVKNWTPRKGQGPKDLIKRWTAVALLSAESSCNYVQGLNEIPEFLQRLHESNLPVASNVA